MNDTEATWRLFDDSDLLFAYELATAVDSRWWRFSRAGLHPHTVLAAASTMSAAVVVEVEGRPVAIAALADTGASGTGSLEFFALPGQEAAARRVAPDVVAAAFLGAPIRRLYHERFEHDPDVLGEIGEAFEVEVTFPGFALVDGRYESRTISVLTRESFERWDAARQGDE